VEGLGGTHAGCPENDPDGDGFVTAEDRCPEMPGEARWDGCPELDMDGDGIRNDTGADHCPELAGVAEHNGCPANDRDGDGILNAEDVCPDVAGRGGVFRGCESLAEAGALLEPMESPESEPSDLLEPWSPPIPDFDDIEPEPLLPIDPDLLPEEEEEEVAPEEVAEGGAGEEPEPIPVGEEDVSAEAPEGAVAGDDEFSEETTETTRSDFLTGFEGWIHDTSCSLISPAALNPVSCLLLAAPLIVLFVRRRFW
jgi:hypothetical protein